MSSVTLAAICCLALGANEAETYDQAHSTTMQTGKPMMVMVTTDWCAPCQVMKKTVMPQVRRRGLLSRVAFAVVNPDHDRDLANRLIGGGPVPQLLMFRKTTAGWRRQVLVGGQSVETVEHFINDAVAQNEAEQPAGEQKAAKDNKAQPQAKRAAAPAGHAVVAASAERVVDDHQPEQSDAQ